MKTSDNRPAIRFTGCTDAWHHCQFNDIVITHPTKQFIKEPSLDGTIEVIQQGNEPVVGYANGSPFEEYASVTVFGDHTVSIYKPKKPFFVATDGTKILSGNNIEGNFFYFLLERYKPIPEGYKRHFTILIEQECNFPKSDEQKHIAQYMLYLDDLIERNKRKYEKLVNLKKAMLDKMFPKNGELVPEVRFSGFSGNWERREMGDIVTEYNDPVATPTTGYYRLGIRSFGKGTFHSFVEPGMGLQTGQMHRVAADKFIVNITFGWEHAVAITTDRDEGKLVSHRFPQFSFAEGMVPSFFKFLILDESFKHHLWLASPGGAGRNRVLKISDMLEYQFWVTSKEEQSEVALFLERVDNLIELQRQKVLRIQNLKKAFLEKMFV